MDAPDIRELFAGRTEYYQSGSWRIRRHRDPEQTRYLVAIHRFLLPEFLRIFRSEGALLEPCDIFCDPDEPTPMLITNRTPIAIRLNVRSTAFWCQVIYQLSHELGHFFVRQRKPIPDRTRILRWFEETFCEAMSDVALEYAAEHWSECDLAGLNPGYATSIREYQTRLLNAYATTPQAVRSPLRSCVTPGDLAELEKECAMNRVARSVERDLIFQHLRRSPHSAATIAGYTEYIRPPTDDPTIGALLLDLDRWESTATPDQLETIHLLRMIHPNIR
ncbi:MAG: hypothetical protein Q4C47_08030 [Planctomycetia bacterium]|nr:hypothetical protein [Planctomycetia bacterium]